MTAAAVVGLVAGPVLGGLALFGTFLAWVLVPLGIGVPLVGRLPHSLQQLSWVERARVRGLLQAPLPEPARRAPPDKGWAGVRATLTDRDSWRTLGWLTGQVLLGPLAFVLVAGLWAAPVFGLSLPIWAWSVDRFPLGVVTVTTELDALLVAGVALLLVPVAALGVRFVGRRLGAGAGRWLGPDVRTVLEAKVADLERTRAIAVSAAESERHRLERDLHDGAQSRLVSLAVTLALAEEALDRDADASRRLLREARGEAVTAVEELRGLARGLAPTLLRARGLQAALDGLAATSTLEVVVDTTGYVEPAGDELASALWFAAAEALTNATKHAGAATVHVDLRSTCGGWVLEVRDDGRGGATVSAGGGLAGLQERLAPFDAVLEVSSGTAGTTLRVRA